MSYILFFGEGDYVETYSLENKSVTTTHVKSDAYKFVSKIEAKYVSERLGCYVMSLESEAN